MSKIIILISLVFFVSAMAVPLSLLNPINPESISAPARMYFCFTFNIFINKLISLFYL